MRHIQDKVAQIFYTHGLFCSSHPYAIIAGVVCCILLSWYPLSNAPLPGNAPLEYITPLHDYQVPRILRPAEPPGREGKHQPRWYNGPPTGYIQQVVVKATVAPWQSTQMIPIDAFRAPLGKVFEVVDRINTFKFVQGIHDLSLEDLCLRVAETVPNKKLREMLPHYSCLMLSPANLWQKDFSRFKTDAEILKTVHQRYGMAIEVAPTLRDTLFGMPWKKTGVSRYFIRNKQRTISFTITMVVKTYEQSFIQGLKNRLESLYPETHRNVNNSEIDYMVHIHYPETNILVEYTPLLITYLVLLLYIFFTVRKIEMVKSKWGLAFSAVFTVVASLVMSLSICTLFGLTPSLNRGEIFPYLVVIVGLENVLVLTKSVVSTPVHLDVKFRIAQGLSKEGWSFTKNLLAELLIVTVGFFTFVPAIQEFCLFALVGLLSDFVLQMVFFVTVLSLDIRRMELSDLHKQNIQHSAQEDVHSNQFKPLVRCPVVTMMGQQPGGSLPRSKSVPGLWLPSGTSVASPPSPPPSPGSPQGPMFFPEPIKSLNIPRRLRLIYFWASTRMFQRLIMVCTVIWIALIVYKTGLVEHLTSTTDSNPPPVSPTPLGSFDHADRQQQVTQDTGSAVPEEVVNSWRSADEEDEAGLLEHKEIELWRQLSFKHWPTIFGYYNISLIGRYLSILPTMHLSITVDPEDAIQARHPSEQLSYPREPLPLGPDGKPLPPTAGSFPRSFKDLPYYMYDAEQFKQFYPKSQREFIITVFLGILSVICITYFMVACYRCLCSKNYSRWRRRSRRPKTVSNYYKQVKESLPLVLKGHMQDVECLVTDGPLIISSCLGGQLKVWDSVTGECIVTIQRKGVTPPMKRKPCVGRNIEDSEADLYDEYHGNISFDTDTDNSYTDPSTQPAARHRETSSLTSRSRKRHFVNMPDLSHTIETSFGDQKSNPDSMVSPLSVQTPSSVFGPDRGFPFDHRFGELFEEHRQLAVETQAHEARRLSSHDREHLRSAASGSSYENENWKLDGGDGRSRSWSAGDLSGVFPYDTSMYDGFQEAKIPPIWCLASRNNLIVTGCGNGRIEFWDGSTGCLKCLYEDGKVGVTNVCFVGHRVVAARLNGNIDFLELETFKNPVVMSPHESSRFHSRGHSRNLSYGSCRDLKLWDEVIHCSLLHSISAHQQPINALQMEGGRVVSASQDHTLKVFRLEDCLCVYTLHGHTGPVTALYLDKCPPYAVASGSADGTIRLWDLLTGTCVHKVRGHSGTVVALTCNLQYVISTGLDEKLCVWERSRVQLLHEIDMDPCCCSSLSLLSNNMLITGGQGCIYLWDVSKGEILRTVNLGDGEKAAFIHHIQATDSAAVVCDYSNEIKLVHFPTVLEKSE